MKKIKNYLLIGILIFTVNSSFTNAQRASLPYSTGFDNWPYDYYNEGNFPEEVWSSSDNYGAVFTVSDNAYTGSQSLNLAYRPPVSTSSLKSETQDDKLVIAYLNLDLSNANNVILDFVRKINFDASNGSADNGVYISDNNGQSYTKVLDINDSKNIWKLEQVNISQKAQQHGLTLNNRFRVMFQLRWSYNYVLLLIDDVSISGESNDCPDKLLLTENNNLSYLASNSIIASNIVSGNNLVHYGANKSVKLNTDFKVAAGSSFLADLNGCSQTKSAKAPNSEMSYNVEKSNISIQDGITLYPNPSTGLIHIKTESDKSKQLQNLQLNRGANMSIFK